MMCCYDATIRGKEELRWGSWWHVADKEMCRAFFGEEEQEHFISSLEGAQGARAEEACGWWGCT